MNNDRHRATDAERRRARKGSTEMGKTNPDPATPTRAEVAADLATALRGMAEMLDTGLGIPVEHQRDGMTTYTMSGQIGPGQDYRCSVVVLASAAHVGRPADADDIPTTVADDVDQARREGLL